MDRRREPERVDAYATSLQHVLAELERIHLLLRLQTARAQQVKQQAARFEAPANPDHEMDAIAAHPTGLPRWATAPLPWPEAEVEGAFARLNNEITARKAESAARGVRLRLDELARHAELRPIDVDILLIGLAPEIDPHYERLFAYLEGDAMRRRPSVDMALNLLCPSLEAKLEARSRFAASAPLLRHCLVELIEDPARPRSLLLHRQIKLDERITRFLLGSDELDAALLSYAHLVSTRACPAEDRSVMPELARRLERVVSESAAQRGFLVHFWGPPGCGKRASAQALCARVGLNLLVVNGEALLRLTGADFELAARLVAREASLQGAALYWEGFDGLLANDRRAEHEALLRALTERRGMSFVAGASAWEPDEPLLRALSFRSVEFPRPTYAERLAIWGRALGDDLPAEVAAELPALASKFRFTGGEIRAAAESARERARGRDPGLGGLTTDDLYASCRARSKKLLGELARKIEPRYTWDDLVLPADSMGQLRELCDQVRYRACVYEEWGFEGKLSLGRGINALFSGPSGTGKTMAAEVLAGALGLDLYKIDISGVVSKYIGETEKNLARIFNVAESSNAILFFDEADALFGKRSEVRDSHDRYANIETSYLLQRMEEYQGVTILATNLRRNMDDAFTRRISFSLTFAMPGEEERLRIWRGVWPPAAPLGGDVDFEFMARQFKLAGGNIKNIARSAAFLAAASGSAVSMQHLIRATMREFQKIGEPCMASELGPHADLLEL